MIEVDYKELLNEIICNANGDELIPLVRCNNLPFEYCEKMLAKKGIGWRTKVQIARREDCPKSVLAKLIKRNGERFLRTYLYGNFCTAGAIGMQSPIEIDNDTADLILKKPFGIEILCWHSNLQDCVLRKITDMIVAQCDDNEATQFFSDFLYYQYRLPNDCIVKLSNLASKVTYRNTWFNVTNVTTNLHLMQELPEDEFVRYIEAYCEQNTMYDEKYNVTKMQLFKIAANPSITKYVEMLLRMRFSSDAQIMCVLDKYEKERIKYRENHRK